MKTETVVAWYIKAEVAFVTVLTVLALYLGWVMFSSPFSRADFDQQVWARAAHDSDRCDTRGEMIDSLLKKHVQIGMEKSKLVALLGQPDNDHGGEISYYLGFCQTFVDPDTLDFYFDNQGALTKHVVKNH